MTTKSPDRERPMETGAALRRRKLHILRSRLKPRAQSFRCSSSPNECESHSLGTLGCPPKADNSTLAPRNVFSATYTPPPKMIAVPFAPTGRETLRGFFDKLTAAVFPPLNRRQKRKDAPEGALPQISRRRGELRSAYSPPWCSSRSSRSRRYRRPSPSRTWQRSARRCCRA